MTKDPTSAAVLGVLVGLALAFVPAGIAHVFYWFKRRAHRRRTLEAFDREFGEKINAGSWTRSSSMSP